MQKLIFLFSFILASSLLKAGDLPKLNLQIGEKYLVETTYHQDTAKGDYTRLYDKKRFEFEATGFNQQEGIYDIKLVLKYFLHVSQRKEYKEWSEKEVYETGLVSTYRNPIVYLNMYQIPVTFKISRENRISSFDFSEFAKYKSPEGLPLSIGEWDQKRFIEEINALFFDPKKTDSFWDHKMDIRSNYKIISEDESTIAVEIPDNDDVNVKAGNANLYGQYKRKILIDKTTGLIIQDQLSFMLNHIVKKFITRYQKLIPELSEKVEVMQKVGVSLYEKNEIRNPNTSIRISVQDSTEYSRYIYLTYWDQATYLLKSFRLKKDKNGDFNFQFNITEPQAVYIQFSPRTMDVLDRENIYLHPGDNLEVEIRKPTEPNLFVFNGIGAGENIVLQTICQLTRTFDQKKGTFNHRTFRNDKDCIIQILNKKKCDLNPDFYLEMLNTYIYSDYSTMLYLIDSIKDYEIPLYNTLASRNPSYLSFLNRYLFSFINKNRRLSTNYTYNHDEGIYYILGQVLFPEPVSTEFLANEVENAIQFRDWQNAKLLYERFKLAYSNSPRFKKTEQLYQREAILSPGQPFPVEDLTDINGKKVDMRNIKDKLVVIRIKDLRIYTLDGMRFLHDADRDYDTFKKDLVFVRLIVGSKEQFTELKDSLKGNPNEILLFKDIEELYWRTNQQIPLLSKSTIVLGREGNILFNQKPDNVELLNAIEDLKKPQPFFGKSGFLLKMIAISLLFLLIVGGLAFIVYRKVSMRKLRQEELKRKMRELELTVIRTQMNPHFMYNCLNSIQNLVQKNRNEEAHLYLSKFASLVRQALNNSKKDEISLSKELDSIKEYIELEQLRFDFEFRLDIGNEVNLNDIFIPPMLLQPFVENAILHGLISKKTDRVLQVGIHKNQGNIRLVIEDNGIGREAASQIEGKGNGQGILLSTDRLSLLTEKTGIHYDLKIEDLNDEAQNPCGTRITIEFIEED